MITMKNKTTRLFLSLASTAVLLTGSSHAANTFYDAGDLMLFFQKVGNNNTVYVSLGNAATNFRGNDAGPTADRQSLNIINISTQLNDAFGPFWATDTSIYAGAVAALSSNASTSTSAVSNGDQHRTLYLSRGRDSVGTVGSANSATYDLTTANPYTTAATNIIGMGNTFEVNGTQQAEMLTVDVSTIDNQNPIDIAPVTFNQSQGTAFAAIAGGIQQRGSASSIGDFGGYEDDVQFALDLYRVVPRADSSTTGEVSGERHIGSFEGTLAIGANGDVSFVTIPEPSSVTLAGIAGLALAFRRRRNA